MPKQSKSLPGMLIESPWWLSIVVAFVAFIGLKFIMPAMLRGGPFSAGIAKGLSMWAIWVAIFFLILGGISALLAWQRRELFKRQTGIDSIRNLSWRGFEDFISEVYRKDGCSVAGNSGPGADGGIDLIARKDEETILIQCKHWKAFKVGVRTVREMFGLLNAERANEVHVVTSGYFTNEAKNFARGKPIKLIDGEALVQFVRKAQEVAPDGSEIKDSPPLSDTSRKRTICPKCGSDMVLIKTSRGVNAGKELWECTKFPYCTGTREKKVIYN